MKKLFLIFTVIIGFYSCDPVADMEANITNSTSEDLRIDFVSFDENSNKTLEILTNETKRFQDGFDIGSTYLEPSLAEYDSVIVKNTDQQILKVYKPNAVGKNIYNIDRYWLSSEPSKGLFIFDYEINNEDLE